MDYIVEELNKENLNNSIFDTLENLKPGEINGNLEEARKSLKEIQHNPNHKIFAAFIDNKIIGLTTIFLERKFIFDFGYKAYIEDVVVNQKYEKKGIGSVLIKKAIDFAKQKRVKKIVLTCKDDKITFYEKFGFKKLTNSMSVEF